MQLPLNEHASVSCAATGWLTDLLYHKQQRAPERTRSFPGDELEEAVSRLHKRMVKASPYVTISFIARIVLLMCGSLVWHFTFMVLWFQATFFQALTISSLMFSAHCM